MKILFSDDVATLAFLVVALVKSIKIKLIKNYVIFIYQVILAFSVFMLAIAERMPETSESIPLIGQLMQQTIGGFRNWKEN